MGACGSVDAHVVGEGDGGVAEFGQHAGTLAGVGVLARRFGLPVYISRMTDQTANSTLGKIADIRYFECGNSFTVNTWTISPFSISHDAEDPAGFTILNNGLKIGIATDLGVVTAMVKERLKACHILILEANHDPEMLINGPYPWPSMSGEGKRGPGRRVDRG